MNHGQQAGKDLDNEVAAAVHRATGDDIRANSRRGSGNTVTPAADVLVRTPDVDHELELKRFSLDRPSRADTIADARAYIDAETFEELQACQNKYTHAYLGVKVTNCEMWLRQAPYHPDVEYVVERVADAIPDAFDPHVTDSNSLRITKPETEEWPTARSGRDDVDVVCDALDIVTQTDGGQP